MDDLTHDLEKLYKITLKEKHLKKLTRSMASTLRYIIKLTKENPSLINDEYKRQIENILKTLESDVEVAQQLAGGLSNKLQHLLRTAGAR